MGCIRAQEAQRRTLLLLLQPAAHEHLHTVNVSFFALLPAACLLLPVCQVLSMFDSDLDFAHNRVRLWTPGTVAQLAASEGLVEVPAAVLNESGIV